MPIDPLTTSAQVTQQIRATVTRQPAPSLVSVQEASSTIVAGIIEPRGDGVGVLTYDRTASPGGLEGAGLYTGISTRA